MHQRKRFYFWETTQSLKLNNLKKKTETEIKIEEMEITYQWGMCVCGGICVYNNQFQGYWNGLFACIEILGKCIQFETFPFNLKFCS